MSDSLNNNLPYSLFDHHNYYKAKVSHLLVFSPKSITDFMAHSYSVQIIAIMYCLIIKSIGKNTKRFIRLNHNY